PMQRATLYGSCKRNGHSRRSLSHNGHTGYSRFAEMSAVGSFKIICLFKTIHMRHVRRVRIYVTTAVPMDRFAYIRQGGGNQATHRTLGHPCSRGGDEDVARVLRRRKNLRRSRRKRLLLPNQTASCLAPTLMICGVLGDSTAPYLPLKSTEDYKAFNRIIG